MKWKKFGNIHVLNLKTGMVFREAATTVSPHGSSTSLSTVFIPGENLNDEGETIPAPGFAVEFVGSPEWLSELDHLNGELMMCAMQANDRPTMMGKLYDLLNFLSPSGEHEAAGVLACPDGEPMHFHHDGCPMCIQQEAEKSLS